MNQFILIIKKTDVKKALNINVRTHNSHYNGFGHWA
jgi:hypothetical protein